MVTKINDEHPLYNRFSFWVLWIGIAIIFTIYLCSHYSHTNKLETLGESMCNNKGLEFDYFEESDTSGYTFYCVNEATKIEDGYLKFGDNK